MRNRNRASKAVCNTVGVPFTDRLATLHATHYHHGGVGYPAVLGKRKRASVGYILPVPIQCESKIDRCEIQRIGIHQSFWATWCAGSQSA